MLNKLLKRCMPWMDKGRWYKIDYHLESGSFNIKHDPIFSSVSVDPNNGISNISLADNRNYQIIDVKFVGQDGFDSIGLRFDIPGTGDSSFDFQLPSPGTAWFFIKFG